MVAFGLGQALYPLMDGCIGQNTKGTELILPLLDQLLD